ISGSCAGVSGRYFTSARLMVFAVRYTRKVAASGSVRQSALSKRGPPFVVGQNVSRQSRTCGMSASIIFQPLQSVAFIRHFGRVTLCSADDDFELFALRLHWQRQARRFRMGLLVEGKWQDRPVKVDSGGRFIRA